MPKLKVEKLPDTDLGRLLVRLNHTHRVGIARYGIAKLTNIQNASAAYVLLLGHERDDAIFMPYDIRESLGVQKGGELDFTVEGVSVLGKLRWYLSSPDPAVQIPAWIAALGLGLAVIGIILGIAPFFSCSS